MGFAQWFWRLFLMYAGLIAAHVLVAGLALTIYPEPGPSRSAVVWFSGGLAIVLGGAATWYCVRRIVDPLARLTEQVQELSAADDPAAIPILARDGLGMLAGAFNQMQRKLARRLEEIEENSKRIETILGSMVEGVLAVQPDRTILLANEAGRRLLDFATPDPVGRPLLEVTRARPVSEAVGQALESAEPVVLEFESPGLSRRTLSLRATRMPGDPCPGVVLVLHDLTELRRLESLRRELVANVSHELKTPLSAIKAYAETLRLGAVNDAEHNVAFVRRIEEQADRLHELILDMLQIARLEQGEEILEIVPLSLSLIDDCCEQFAERAAAKQIALAWERPPGDLRVLADEEGLRTIVNNLLDNALKFTPSGGQIAIRARAEAGSVAIEFQDTGIGIAQADQARIFERFYRVDKARSRELGGTGLGLSIVKHLAQSMGGSVHVESAPGRGSTFRVHLPRAK